MNHVMIDLETLGTNPNAPIASIGAVFFNPQTGELGEQFYCRVDFVNHMQRGASPDGDTIKWWLRQSPEARAELVRDDSSSIFEALDDVRCWLLDNVYDINCLQVWAKAPSFDCVILRAAFNLVLGDAPWHYRNEQDVRTIEALARYQDLDIQIFKVGKHHALADAVNQAALVSAVISRLAQNQGSAL
ncbi:3'-5' exonuclease [Symbiopectobacterium purcellii]|uniref:3'-5' exonuclease n=1 Tax=Symbiopectobacterium purcellii TaxID=2871826 RepID=UPI003F8796CE